MSPQSKKAKAKASTTSKHLSFISSNWAVIQPLKKPKNVGNQWLEEHIIVPSHSKYTRDVLQSLELMAVTSREHLVQRNLNKNRLSRHGGDLQNFTMTDISVEIILYHVLVGEELKLRMVLGDGQHRVNQALTGGFLPTILISIRLADDKEAMREMITKFDSRDSSRTPRDIARYVFSDWPEVLVDDILQANSPIQYLTHSGAYGIDEVAPNFSTEGGIQKYRNFTLTRSKYKHVLDWVTLKLKVYYKSGSDDRKFPCKKVKVSMAIKAAIIQSWALYGEDVMKVWERYLDMTKAHGHDDPMYLLYTYMVNPDKKGGGGRVADEEYNIASWAFLAATNKFGLENTTYNKSATYTLMDGMKGPTKKQAKNQSKARQKAAA